jgi:hypothetical protein
MARRFKGSDDYVRIKVCALPYMGINAEDVGLSSRNIFLRHLLLSNTAISLRKGITVEFS